MTRTILRLSPIDAPSATVYPENEGENTASLLLYRAGQPNPSNLKLRAVDQRKFSFQNSLSNPWPLGSGGRPVFQPGDTYIAVDPSRLQPGSVIFDHNPPGHVLVRDVPPEVHHEAVVERGKFPAEVGPG